MPKVSIIVPIYNVESYLSQCIESFCNQTLKDIEIILVDDGSPDNCGAICDQYAELDPRIKVLHKENAGVGAARNDGLRLATGEYVVFVDSDDYVPDDAYQKMYSNAVQNDADVVLADIYTVQNGHTHYVKFFEKPFVTSDRKLMDEMVKSAFYNYYCPMPPASGPAYGYGGPTNKLVRRSILTDNNIWFDTSVKGVFDDVIYSAYVFACAGKISYIEEPVYYYRLLENSITRTYKANMLEINAAIFDAIRRFCQIYGPDGQFDNAYYAVVIRRLNESLFKFFFNKDNDKSHKESMQQLQNLLHTEPYVSAVHKIDVSILNARYKIITRLSASGSAHLLMCGVSGIRVLSGFKRMFKR